MTKRTISAFQLFIKKNFQKFQQELALKNNGKPVISSEVFKLATKEYKLLSEDEKNEYLKQIPPKIVIKANKPRTAYSYFVQDYSILLKDVKIKASEKMKQIAIKWKELGPEERKKYEILSMDSRLEYLKNKVKKD